VVAVCVAGVVVCGAVCAAIGIMDAAARRGRERIAVFISVPV